MRFCPCLVFISLLGAFVSGTALPATAQQVLRGHVPKAVKASDALGGMPADARMDLSIGLPLRNPEALAGLLAELYDPRSPSYRQFLTTEQFTERFGPSAADYDAVKSFLERHGFVVSALHSNRMLVEFSGSVSQAEEAFRLRLRRYRHPHEEREFYAPDAEPSLELGVPVLDISGLDNFVVPHPANLTREAALLSKDPRALAGSGPSGSYMGVDFRAAYAPNVLLNGSGQYVGLVQFDGYYASDIAAYVSRVPGMTNVALTNILLGGFDGTPGTNNVEVALDIEMAMSMAPGLSAIMVYEGYSANSILNRMATDNIAKQLSASWTFGVNATTTQIFQQFAAQGQSYFNASGDDGAYTADIPAPSDNPYITSVGGTTLSTKGPGAGWLSETTWNWNGTGGSGGGVSRNWNIPAWQQGLDMTASKGSTIMRNIPDVAMVADNVFLISDNGKQSYVGGTSVGSPLWAGYTALINQQAALTGQPTVGFLNPAVYALGLSTNYASSFHDIRTGNNTNSASPTLYFAVASYDLCTGWGTPAGRSLINALAPPPNYPILKASGVALLLETCNPTNGAADPGEVVMMNFSLQNYGGVSATNLQATLLATNGIAPITESQTYGVVAQGTTVSRSFTFIPNGSCGTTVNPVLQLQDGNVDLGTVSFSLLLGASRNALAENFDGVTPPALPAGWIRAATASVSNWVTSASARDSFPNAAFAAEPPYFGVCDLLSPSFAISTDSAQLIFRHSYNTEVNPSSSTEAYDGGVLDMKIGNSLFRDILLQGGSFVNGGYTRTIVAADNPLNNRQAWGGASGGFITTIVNLPATAAGKTVQFKWRLGMNTGNTYTASGWSVDSIAVKDGYACCSPASSADLAITQSAYPSVAVVGQSVAYSLTVTSLGPGPALGVWVSNTIPSNAAFVWASPGYTTLGDTLAWNLGLFPMGRTTNFTVLVNPTGGSELTNTANVTSLTDDPVGSNNLAAAVLQIANPPVILDQPLDQVALIGADVVFQARAIGTEPLSYQWRFLGTNLPGQTQASLTLTNIQPGQAGGYSVLVSNVAGSTNSLTGVLKVLVPPEISLSAVGVTGTNVSLSLSSTAGLTYALEYKDFLTDPVWLPAGSGVAGTGGVIVLQDTNAALPAARFYRVNCY